MPVRDSWGMNWSVLGGQPAAVPPLKAITDIGQLKIQVSTPVPEPVLDCDPTPQLLLTGAIPAGTRPITDATHTLELVQI